MHKKIVERQAAVTQAIVDGVKWTNYFKEKTEKLMQPKGIRDPQYFDIVTDVINLLPIYWICEEIVGAN